MIGKTLRHYKIGEQLGRGGMGEVYAADDLNLNRKVALKFLPDAFADDPGRMARFEREARLLASLNHPNIAGIYGLEQAEGKRFIVMELVEGETLAQRLSKGALAVDDALAICRRIADGLEAAHEKGVIHRDLKPANVMITEGDKVKILDFGLAKALSDETQNVDSSQSPTLTEAMTRPGVILGTAAYMSPEQAKGKSVDRRADIWAFGCILYECLTGKRAFEGETVTETLASVLTKEPEWEKVPARIRPLLRRCLEKDLSKRVRDIGEAMEWIEIVPESAPVKRPWLAWGAAALFFLVALALALPYFREKPVPQGAPIRFQIDFPDRVRPNTTGAFALSPDGRHLAFAGVGSDGVERLWLRTLESLEARALRGTESNWISTIFWLADSRFIVFPAGGKLKKVDICGGPPQILCDLNNIIVGGSSNRDGVVLFAENPSNAISRISAAGGDASIVIKPDPKERETYFFHPIFLPDGQHFLYLIRSRTSEKTGIYAGILSSRPEEWLQKKILSTDVGIAYTPSQDSGTGQLLFLRDETLMAQQFDEKRLERMGQEVAVAEPVGFIYGVNGFFSASKNGTLVFRSGSFQMQQLAWFDRKGKPMGAVDASGASCSGLALSPDGLG
jgi:eukaryotic-like serine/threonine-protein kinase